MAAPAWLAANETARRNALTAAEMHARYYTILTQLYYTILYYTILYCTIIYYTTLYYTIICYTKRNGAVQRAEGGGDAREMLFL